MSLPPPPNPPPWPILRVAAVNDMEALGRVMVRLLYRSGRASAGLTELKHPILYHESSKIAENNLIPKKKRKQKSMFGMSPSSWSLYPERFGIYELLTLPHTLCLSLPSLTNHTPTTYTHTHTVSLSPTHSHTLSSLSLCLSLISLSRTHTPYPALPDPLVGIGVEEDGGRHPSHHVPRHTFGCQRARGCPGCRDHRVAVLVVCVEMMGGLRVSDRQTDRQTAVYHLSPRPSPRLPVSLPVCLSPPAKAPQHAATACHAITMCGWCVLMVVVACGVCWWWCVLVVVCGGGGVWW